MDLRTWLGAASCRLSLRLQLQAALSIELSDSLWSICLIPRAADSAYFL